MMECRELVKRYGKTVAVDHLSLRVEAGEVHGFVGPNGAGKTTTMRILATLMQPTAGDAFVDGVSAVHEPQKVRALVGYMPDFFGVYDNLKAWEYLDFYAGCVSMDARTRRRRIDELLELTALTSKREAYVDQLSRGMKQRLCLARALMHDPKLLILDEPASGMDPLARAQMREILREIGQMGKTVLISSHILPELSELCTSMTVLQKGRAVFSGSVAEMERRMHGAPLVIRLAEQPEEPVLKQAAQALETLFGQPPAMEPLKWRMEAQAGEQTDAQALRALVELGVPVCGFGREHATLEKAFMEVTGAYEAEPDL
ncbi:MAG: ABC transporter ATP-binding protein [Clostridia bacterium]|nr:ABC transporter ATP-binding protein [Clostridia bacterium]